MGSNASGGRTAPQGEDLEVIAGWLREAFKVVVLTGAGISTESGIPDFRGRQGLWTTDPGARRRATLDHYMSSRAARVEAWRMRMEHPARKVAPNAGRYALADLQRRGKLHTLITQNIDSLHQRAGTTPDVLVEIHGTIKEVVCMECGERTSMEAALGRVRAGEDDPSCRACGGILKSATVSFGQNLVAGDLERARAAALSADLFLAAGTSLSVFPAGYLPALALDAGARLVILNAGPTRYDQRAHAVLREPLGRVLPAIVDLV
ncbi:MAG: NAD-dependent deacetylase [Actinobacteria bacterium]|nr:NAD-dependent deacetylase [Actinomycetota bacterium]